MSHSSPTSQALTTIPSASTAMATRDTATQGDVLSAIPPAGPVTPDVATGVATEAVAPAASIWDMIRPEFWRPTPVPFFSPFLQFHEPFAGFSLFPGFDEPFFSGWPHLPTARLPRWDFGVRASFDDWLSGVTRAFDTMIRSRFGPSPTWTTPPQMGEPQVLERSFDENGWKGRERAVQRVIDGSDAPEQGRGVYRTYQMVCANGTAPTMKHHPTTLTSGAPVPKWTVDSVEETNKDSSLGSDLGTAQSAEAPTWKFSEVVEPEDTASPAQATTPPSRYARPMITDGYSTLSEDLNTVSDTASRVGTASTAGPDRTSTATS